MEAASGGYSDIVKLLISHGANVNAKSRVEHLMQYVTCTEIILTLLITIEQLANFASRFYVHSHSKST